MKTLTKYIKAFIVIEQGVLAYKYGIYTFIKLCVAAYMVFL